MNTIPESELIINNRGAIYHLDVRPDELATTVITVGDPDRVSAVSKHFDSIEVKCHHREFVTHTGYINNKRISVVSTGIGPDNIDIVLNELDALANIDFNTRTIKSQLTQLQIIRMGTSGALQPDIHVDSFVASTHAIGMDNLLHYYQMQNNDAETAILQAFLKHTKWENAFSLPYISMSGASLLKHFVHGFHQGITVTCPGFYGPQGRVLRMGLRYPQLINQLTSFRFGNYYISNFEMETSAIYGIGALQGHSCLSLSAIVANRVQQTFSKDGQAAVEKLISYGLEIISSL
jgi:uridine phosphorylase